MSGSTLDTDPFPGVGGITRDFLNSIDEGSSIGNALIDTLETLIQNGPVTGEKMQETLRHLSILDVELAKKLQDVATADGVLKPQEIIAALASVEHNEGIPEFISTKAIQIAQRILQAAEVTDSDGRILTGLAAVIDRTGGAEPEPWQDPDSVPEVLPPMEELEPPGSPPTEEFEAPYEEELPNGVLPDGSMRI